MQSAIAAPTAVAQLLDVAREALLTLSPSGTITYWSGGAERMVGYTAGEAVGRRMARLLCVDARWLASRAEELVVRGRWSGDVECRAADGRRLQLECHCEPAFDAGVLRAVHCALIDASERRRAEKEIVLLHNVMEQRIRRRTAELEETNEDLRDFAYSLAHDLRAPLASIDGFSAQLETRLSGTLDAKSAHYLERVRAGVRLMKDLTDGLLALANISHAPLLHQRVDLSAVARSIALQLKEAQPWRSVAFTAPDVPAAQGDIRLLTDVLQNLLGNAWKFTARVPQAQVQFGASCTECDTHVQYHVKDNGAGFDPAYAYKLFGPFQRLHGAGEFEGHGIGLAMVRKIVSRHGGRVWAESQPGRGAAFYFTLGNADGMRR